ncbi:hypothetical protein HDU84_005769, partial [Entophlyctis sp. JEL0112]
MAEICSAFPTAGSSRGFFFASRTDKSLLCSVLLGIQMCRNIEACPISVVGRSLAHSSGLGKLARLSFDFNFVKTSSVASDVTGAAQLLMNEPVAFNITGFDADLSDLTACATQFGLATGVLLIATAVNLLEQRRFVYVYYLFALFMIVSIAMNLVWLPIAVASSYGFQDSTFVWTATTNQIDGTSMGYVWMLSFLFPLSTLVGFDASGHVAEETKNASVEAPAGMVKSVLWSAVICFPTIIIWLYCLPDVDDFLGSNFSSNVQIIYMYQQAFGNYGQAAVVGVSTLLWILNSCISLNAASRVIYAIARDGMLPFRSFLVSKSTSNQPYGSIFFTSSCTFVFLLTILPSQYAFASITSASVISNIAAYAFIIGGRITLSKDTFVKGPYHLGRWSIILGYVSVLFSAIMFVTLCLPTDFPVTPTTLNYAPVIFAIWMIICVVYWVLSGRKWFKGPAGGVVAEATKSSPDVSGKSELGSERNQDEITPA